MLDNHLGIAMDIEERPLSGVGRLSLGNVVGGFVGHHERSVMCRLTTLFFRRAS
jgi:hypothetical protein